ncbi:MAG: histidine phosphatase family protein [Deltaproteobacteria bacterium]|nr:histidine phosphatase family protein [Deltaproteobacteria bacterium]
MKSRLFYLTLALVGGWAPGVLADTSVVIVRHAEKVKPFDGEDPPLTPAGEARAQALAHVLSSVPLDRIYSTTYLRNRATALPTALAQKRELVVVDAKDTAGLAKTLKALKDQTVLVVGHSNTVPELLGLLGIKDAPALEDPDYDNLFVVSWAKDRPARLLRLHFGAKAP